MKHLFTILFLFLVVIAMAQTKGKINGTVLDSESKKPIDFCTLSLLNANDSAIITGVLSAETGRFQFEQVAKGNYFIKAAFVGFEPTFSAKIVIDDEALDVKLRPIFMKLKVMKTVEITAEKSTLQLEPDKKVFNVEKSIISQGGTAADVLKNVPTINVDADGNMNLRGSDNITIYIDGRQSAQMSSNPTQALQQLPAGMIEKVEIITNPGSKYEASGSTGIINIVTKKNGQKGWNGSITAGFGDNDKFNTINKFNNSLLLNYSKNKFNFFTNYSYRNDTRSGYGIMNQNLYSNSLISAINNNSTSINTNIAHNIKAGVDYNFSKTLSSGLSASRTIGNQDNNENYVFYNLGKANDTIAKNKRISDVLTDTKNADAAFYIKKLFKKKGHSLGLDANYSDNISNQTTNYSDYLYNIAEKYYYGIPTLVMVTQPTHNTTSNIQTDYTNSFSKIKFETGLRYTQRVIDNTFLQDTSSKASSVKLNNNFVYTDKVTAGYVSASTEISGYKLKAGLRAENTDYNFNQITLGKSVGRSYFNVFPTASLGKKLKHEVDFSASYSMRITRPSTNQLNPLPDISNPTNTMVGNPNLKPVLIHAVEATFSKYFGQQFVLGTVYVRRQVNNIQRFVSYDSLTSINTITFKNLNNSTNYGLELVTKNQITNKVDITSNINVYQQQLNGNNIEPGLNNSNFTGSFRLILNAKLPKDFALQLSESFNAPSRSLLGRIKTMAVTEIGVRKDFFNHKLTTALSFNDVFNAQRFRINITNEIDNFTRYMERKRESRIIQFSLSYRFGQADSKKMKLQQEKEDRQGGGMDMY